MRGEQRWVCGRMDNYLPEFKRIDASGSQQLNHLHWDTTASLRQDDAKLSQFREVEVKVVKPPPPLPKKAPVITRSKDIPPEPKVPLAERERGDAKQSQMHKFKAHAEVKSDFLEPPGDKTTLVVLNDDDVAEAELYLSRDSITRGIRIVGLPRVRGARTGDSIALQRWRVAITHVSRERHPLFEREMITSVQTR